MHEANLSSLLQATFRRAWKIGIPLNQILVSNCERSTNVNSKVRKILKKNVKCWQISFPEIMLAKKSGVFR